MKKRLIPILLILMLAIVSCSEKKEKADEVKVYTEDLSKEVTKITNGRIKSTDLVKISFASEVVGEEEINKETENKIRFSPSIEGKAYWEKTNLLVFEPAAPLEYRKKYSASLDLSEISEKYKGKNIEELKFDFEIMGRELFSFSGELTLKTENSPKILNYRGKVVFSEETDPALFKEAFSLRSGSSQYEIEIFPETDNRSFNFVSEDLERDNRTKDFKITIDKNLLDLSEDFEKEFQITPVEKMQVVNIKLDEEGRKPKARIEFSDDIDFEQNVSGLVRVENMDDIKIQKIGSSLILEADFNYGSEYVIIVEEGLRSRWGSRTVKRHTQKIKFCDIKPQIEFVSDGVFLPPGNQYKLQFFSSNLKRVHVEVKKVYEKSLAEFLRTERLNSTNDRKTPFQGSYINRVGVIIHNESFEIGDQKNKYLLNEIDLTKVVEKNDKGLYLIRLNFNPRDMLVAVDENNYEYIEKEGQIYKPLFFSNIGLICKTSDNVHTVYATDLNTGKPLSGVDLKLVRTYDPTKIDARATTDDQGKGKLKPHRYESHYIEAEKDGQRSVIKFNEMQWNISGFDIGGIDDKADATNVYFYSERGVYRPGDEINLSAIVRHKNSDYPENRPITLDVFNPARKKIYEITDKENEDGFYNFKIQTKETDQTGNWRAEFQIGKRKFSHTIKIETIVPYRLKVKIEPENKKLLANHKFLKADVVCNYLFGNAGSDLQAEVDVEINAVDRKFSKFSNFTFSNPMLDFKTIQKKIFTGKLDEKGIKHINWSLPVFNAVPSALNLKLTATVLEKGGRPNKNWVHIPIEPYSHFVGIQGPKYSYIAAGTDMELPVIMVNPDGTPMAGKTIKYRIYRNNRYWWWQYNNKKLKFKSDYNTVLVEEGEITSQNTHTNIKFVPIEKGSYLIEVIDESGTGHSSGVLINAYARGGTIGGDKDAGSLALNSDKEKYYVGDEALIEFPSPGEGAVLLTIERFNKILKQEWYYPEGDQEMKIKIPITKEMVPNSYVSVSLLQPHSQTVNDRPIRMFGLLPIMVEDRDTKHFFDIKTSSQFRPEEEFEINIQSSVKEQTQFTIAVVDEGLLDITQFQTPDPWKHFFRKIRLAVSTYDLFSHVISANIGDVFKTFSIGGDMDYRESQLPPEKGKKRFKPVSFFKGPLKTDMQGKATVKFKMPNYIGSVRIMVIGAKGNSFARAEKTVPVKTELMLLPTLPRVVGPNEKFKIPVSVFAMKEGIGDVKVEIKTEGPLNIESKKNITLNFDKTEDKDCYFEVSTKSEIGQSKVVITAASDRYNATYEVDLMVRPSSPRIYKTLDYKTTGGENIKIDIPGEGLTGTNRATLTISNFPNINFGHRMKWLIRYPYGCIEQTTSASFPQLFLKKFIKYPEAFSEDIDININQGLNRLRRFQTFSGGFGYWPYAENVSNWGTLYAGHFIVEAKKLGYHVAEDMYINWQNYTRNNARRHRGDLMYRVYRSYILALDENAELSEMNSLKESSLQNMNDTQKWLLAAAYKLAGLEQDAESIIFDIGTETADYSDFSGTYGSGLRDKAMILDAMVVLEKYDLADEVTKAIASAVATRSWYSTQTIGYSLLAIGKYMQAITGNEKNVKIKGTLNFADGTKMPFENDRSLNLDIDKGFGGQVELEIDKQTNVDRVYATLAWDGVPLKSNVVTENKNLKLQVNWHNENGDLIDPSNLNQGTTFWGHFNVENISDLNSIEEIALMQILPSGWEIVNTRLLNESLPEWTEKMNLNREEYLDIRDDRIMWFFDLCSNKNKYNNRCYKLDFVFKLNAVTVGEFELPGTLVEAMYNNNFRASKAGMKVRVAKP